ncbi:MAG TPA: LUD domain-containing protein [Tepidisphaeraceae bacterium]|nr:LUD domain-containing protein [Tepidisphaeraceae bacterium]
MTDDFADTILRIRSALGRKSALAAPPTPPEINEPITRLVHFDIGLAELFAKTAQAAKMSVTPCRPEEISTAVGEFLKSANCRRIALSSSPLLDRLGLLAALQSAGFEARSWQSMTLDELYDFDCGITEVYRAVAETGSLVIRPGPAHGRGLSLVCPIYVAIVEPKNLVPDLVDLFEILAADPFPAATHIMTGPSKTADIEMNLVTGVHGPGRVQVFLIQ